MLLDTLKSLHVRRVNGENRFRCHGCQPSQRTAEKWKGKIDLRDRDGERRLFLYCFVCDPAGRGRDAKAATLAAAGLSWSDLVVNGDDDFDAAAAELGVVPQKYKIADRDTLDRVYRSLLGRCLGDLDVPYPKSPSFPAALADDMTRDFGRETLLRVPGFLETPDGVRLMGAGVEGVLIPCRDVVGRIFSVKIRRAVATSSGKMLTLSSKSCGGPGPIVEAHVAGLEYLK